MPSPIAALPASVQNITKTILIAFLLTSATISTVSAQRPDYKITATLDTSTHIVKGSIDISYTNQSKNPLEKLAIHLWPNAYNGSNSALVNQKLYQDDLTLYSAKQEDLGSLYGLNFTSTNNNINFITDPENVDISWINLTNPLLPGETINISSPYSLKVPVSFSRLGRTGRSYQITQWYPHIAVYDEEGWHAMPYLDQGEFFNDFADYEVTIKTPVNYNVAATGALISTNQKGKLTERIYKAENVIDFAWFTSPTFRHERKLVDVGRTDKLELNLFVDSLLNNNWDTAMVYAERALKFYSRWLGPYPYPQMTVVYTPFSKAGYMEYPMVAQIGYTPNPQFLDRVIAHEIGHTWLYGILASNEREHPWLDEGFNSFLENEYMHTYYTAPVEVVYPEIVHSKHSMDHYHALQHIVRSKRELDPPLTSPVWQKTDQYISSAYLLPSQGLKMMKAQLGEDMMREMFSNYFEDLRFTHVSPGEVRTSFEKTCKCNLEWFFAGWLNHSHEVDYRIRKLDNSKNELTVLNKGTTTVPLSISEYSDGKKVAHLFIDGFEGEKVISLSTNTNEVRLFDGYMTVNKQWWKNIFPRNRLPQLNLVPKIGNYHRPTLAFTPVIGYNITDGGMPGLAITSDLIPQPRFKFLVMPMYGLESKKIRYYSEGRYAGDIDRTAFDKFLIGLSASSFGYYSDTNYFHADYFTRLSPSIALRMDPPSSYSNVTKWWTYRYVDITQHYARGIDVVEGEFVVERRNYGVHELSFLMSSDIVLKPYKAHAALQAGKGFLRLNLHYNQHFRGKNKMLGIWVHGFAGWLPVFKQPDATVRFSFNGITSSDYFSNDYMYDEWLPGRNATGGNVSRQVFMKDAGLKTLANFGLSDTWMTGAGFSYAMPFKVIHFYMDAALYESVITENVAFSYSGGMSIVLMKDVFEIYIPFLESKDIRESLTYQVRDQWYDRISFQANFKLANPLLLLDRFQYKY